MLKVLLVDDEEDFLKVIKKRMDSWDCVDSVVPARNGQEALEIIKNGNIDLVVLDYMMPVMDGISTLKEIRRINPLLRVIMFTAYPAQGNMEEAIGLKVDAFIPKFSDMSDVQSSLKAAVCGLTKQRKEES